MGSIPIGVHLRAVSGLREGILVDRSPHDKAKDADESQSFPPPAQMCADDGEEQDFDLCIMVARGQ